MNKVKLKKIKIYTLLMIIFLVFCSASTVSAASKSTTITVTHEETKIKVYKNKKFFKEFNDNGPYKYVTRTVNARIGPNDQYKILYKLTANTRVKTYGRIGNYTLVKYNSKFMFIYTKFLSKTKTTISPSRLKKSGVIRWGNYKWTWYTQRILPGKSLKIPGRHLDSNGLVCDKNNYIVVAANKYTLKRGSVINTPFGKKAKVYDTGCSRGVIDVYTNW